ncbi:uncharacterized protein PpBr36_06578 [Pyricularia pennisetigena]|uniref:uncharacterized protein n=1 Tax=Pyricularia pennisetigena TaxID=1578925 RepID=UPI00114D7D51|nr:uncharacterized protein PpBr36_06578 [Pyricularia pennisetigena]TLS22980.1 hypothetical protein PpBr36_06578 [Pyricularia pennisetigena]
MGSFILQKKTLIVPLHYIICVPSLTEYGSGQCGACAIPSRDWAQWKRKALITLEPQGSAYPWDQNQGSEGVASCTSVLRRR